MAKNNIDRIANKLVNAFLKNKLISPIPTRYTKKINQANKLRKLCESKIQKPIAGFKAGGTGIPLLKKLKEKEPFYASVYSHNVLKDKKTVKINKYTLGIELEVCYIIKKNFLDLKRSLNNNTIKKYISYIAPCIEIVGYRQRKKGIKSLGDLCSDFGGNYKFIIGAKIKYKNKNVKNLKTILFNKKINYSINGNTNTVYINPLNSLVFVLRKLIKDKVKIHKDFYVFTGSTIGVAPINGKGIFKGKIDKLGSVTTKVL